jgi:hypothetical protein
VRRSRTRHESWRCVLVGEALTYGLVSENGNPSVKITLPGLVLSLLLLVLCGASTANAAPRVEIVGGEVIDFGRGRPGRFERQIAITNRGTDTLRIIAVGSGCGCLVGEPDRSALGPGDTALVKVSVETSGQVVERWQKALTVTTNDPSRPLVDVTVLVRFHRDLRVHSLLNTVQRSACAAECTWTIEIENVGDSALVVNPPLAEEQRGLRVTFDQTRPRTLAVGERVTITGRITILGGEQYPSARVALMTSSAFDGETYVAWFYAPE